ncbi:STAS domain-containing protein [Spirilliplanes yamanashiensis]|uniref:STAS domain-containing protein n=1 Tax=Spirilliplanes yamanashiensis TaxID=42233 RepID=A0A8J3YFG2_9ACTN|nr:STAS domain-containing protein [Spirilliplanes yamanashiensis]MDP9818280.1 anti-anti-sigma regulatory factor/anti-sigma regulatory factor (Ser/Thr protein kinase) [Spirilliplanes yamanashiensis]GIJ06698.1 hypothetical protein Sya03_60500 [Spirilliplanes yamanashiensis]
MALRCLPRRDLTSGVTTVRLTGDLDARTASDAREAIEGQAAECPAAVIVDVGGVRAADAASCDALIRARDTAADRWGVPVLLCSAPPDLAGLLGAGRRRATVYPDQHRAVRAVAATVPRWQYLQLPPVPEAVSDARGLVGDACLSWGLTRLRDAARLVATELAANAVRHARTEFAVTTSLSDVYLRVGVQDGSPVIPPGPTGRGLMIVARLAEHWTTVRLPAGKLILALLRRRGPAGTPGHAATSMKILPVSSPTR